MPAGFCIFPSHFSQEQCFPVSLDVESTHLDAPHIRAGSGPPFYLLAGLCLITHPVRIRIPSVEPFRGVGFKRIDSSTFPSRKWFCISKPQLSRIRRHATGIPHLRRDLRSTFCEVTVCFEFYGSQGVPAALSSAYITQDCLPMPTTASQ